MPLPTRISRHRRPLTAVTDIVVAPIRDAVVVAIAPMVMVVTVVVAAAVEHRRRHADADRPLDIARMRRAGGERTGSGSNSGGENLVHDRLRFCAVRAF